MKRLTIIALLFSSACATQRGRPFDNSSVDFNGRRVQRMETVGEYETIVDAIVSIMESRGAMLVKRRERSPGMTVLSFRIAAVRLASTTTVSSGTYVGPARWFPVGTFSGRRQTYADYVSYGGLYYVELAPTPRGASIQALGLPVVDGLTACPHQALTWRECAPAQAVSAEDFADAVRRRGRVDVRGMKESEIIAGLFSHLGLKRWQDYFRASLQSGETRQPPPNPADDAFNEP